MTRHSLMVFALLGAIVWMTFSLPSPYGRVAITQQPQMNFGQSWPSLVYLPIISFFDSTQRWQLFGMNSGLTTRETKKSNNED